MQIYNNSIIVSGNSVINRNGEIKKVNVNEGNSSFQNILNNKIDESNAVSSLQFSKHAFMRLSNRNLSLSDEQIKRIEGGVEKADKKGIKDSLVLVDDIALVVNIKNKTIITAMNKETNDYNIFTNIDGAVIV